MKITSDPATWPPEGVRTLVKICGKDSMVITRVGNYYIPQNSPWDYPMNSAIGFEWEGE